MPNENELIEIPEDESLEGFDENVELKAKAEELQKKHREAGIRNRERTKALKDRITELEAKVSTKPEPEKKPEEFGLIEKTYLRAAGITAEDEVELAKTTAKKWGMELDKLVDDDDFKVKLETLRTNKANLIASSNIKGGTGTSEAKNTLEYWKAKGLPPTPDQIPDRSVRAKIVRAMVSEPNQGKTFYND